MNKRIQKFLSIIVLGSFIFSQVGYISETFAKSGGQKKEKHFSLADKYKGKQLERVKKGFEGKNTYKVLIQSSKTLDQIQAEYAQLDKKTSIKEVSEGVFQIRFPKSSSAFSSFGSDVDSGSIPASFGGEPVIEPEVFQSFDSNYLQGENLSNLWAVQKVGADSFQESLSSLPKTSVAILDTGIDMTHPDLTNNIDTGLSYDFINESSSVIDDNGHGTQVAGIIGAQVNGSGIFGVDSNTNLVSLKVLDTDGLGTSYDFLEALHYAVNHNIKIVNVSFGGAGDPTTSPVCQAISDAKSKGIFTVVAAGNTNTDVSQIIPAGCSDTITVGAYDKAGNKAAFSNYGTGVDVYAPGVDMYTTERDGSYTTKEGTSFSAPIVSGLIAKELTFSSGATYDEVLSHLKTNYSLVSSYSSVDTENSSSGSTTGTGNMAGNSDIVGTGSITGTGGSTGVTPIDYSSYKYYSGTFLQDGKKYGNSLYSPDMNFRAENLTGVNVYTYDEYKALLKTQKKEFSAMSVPTDGLVGKWELNGNTNDTSGNGNNGTLLGTGNDFSSDSTYGAVYTPNGTDNYMVAPDSLDLKSSSSFSYGLWYNSGTKGGHKFLISKHNSDEDMDYELQITDTGHVRALINDGTLRILDSTDIPSSGVWHHLFVTFTNGIFTLYIDGVANNSLSNIGALRSSNSPFTLGVRGPSSGAYYADGKFHNVLVYNRSLSASEVQNLYESSLPVVTNSLTSGLVGKWDLNGNANDTSGNGNNGTPVNVTWVDSGRGDGKQVASFDGVNSFISLAKDANTYLYNDFSISAYAKLTGDNSRPRIIYQMGNSGLGYGYYHWYSYQDFFFPDPNTPYDNEFHLYTIVKSSVDGIKLYRDGVLVVSNSDTSGVNPGYPNVNIGHFGYPGDSYFSGLLSDIRIYNRVLSASEVQQLYQDTQGTFSSTLNNQTSANTLTLSQTSPLVLNNVSKFLYADKTNAAQLSNAVIKQKTDTAKADNSSLGDPVNLETGEFTYGNTLMSIPGNGLPFQFDIHYKNQVFYNGPLGVNWDHNYNIYLSEEANGNILFYNGKLGIYRFLKSGDTFEYNEGLKATLQNIGGNYVLTYDSGLQYFFNADKKVAKIQDRYNNALLFTYTNGLLTTVTDTLGRTISYTYYDHNRLKDVTDFNGKKVSFTYYNGTETTGGQYDLKSIMIDQGDNHTKTISFEYTTGGDDTSNHNLTKLIDSKGQTYVTNVYDVNDRVASQTYGDGTIYYDYTLDSGLVSKNTVTDKEGNVVDYFYNANGNNTEAVYHKPSGNITYQYAYNAIGYMTSEKKPNGNGTKFSYDTRGNLTEKREKTDINSFDTSADIVTTYTYNARNQVLTETLDTGVSTTFTYDTDGNLTQKVISGLKTSTGATYETSQHFTYGANGLPLTSTDESGKVTSYSYTTGLVSGIVDDVGGLGLTKAITYDTYGQPLSQTDAKGKGVNFTLSPFEQILSTTTPAGIVTHTEYDANNNKTKETIDLGGGKTKEVNYTYNLLDKVTAITEEYNDGTTVTTHIIYDKNGNIIKKYTGDGAPTEYSYDHLGHLTQEKVIPNASDNSQDIVTNYVYDANGNLISKTDPQGNATTYAYDGFDRLITQTDSLGNTTEWTYFTDNTIHTIIAKDSSGNALAKTEFVTDGRGKTLKKITYKNPTGNETVEESVDYNALGQPIRSVDKKGNITTTAYDTLGRVISTTDSLGNSVHQTYDANGNILTKTITPSTGTGVLTTTYAYDDDNRLVSQTNQLGKTQTYTYNALGNIVTKTDENGIKTEYTYDYRGKVLSETKDPESSSGGQVTVYTYDERGNMTSVTDPKGNITTYTYNNLNELTKQTYQDGKEVVYTYDKAGNVITKTDPNGNIITHTYDALNRLVSKNISPGTGILGVTSESYTYDQLGRLVQANDSNNHTLTFNYDSLNRLTQESQSGADVSYTYDDNNNLMSITSPEGKTTNYSYDELNRITNISQSGSSIATYNYAGIFNTDIQYGNSTHITKSYDALNRLSSLHNGLKDYSYTYDDVSNITSDNYKSYAYDNMYRLTQVNETSSGTNLESFSYDAAGNRTNSNTSPQSSPQGGEEAKSYTTNNLNQYTSLSGTTSESFSYDNNGNLKQNGKYNFSYDYKNRLVQVTDLSGSGIVAEFSYDVLGRRYEKKTSTETVQYVYSNENVLSEYKTINGITLKKDYINGIGTDNLVAVEQEENSLTQVEKEELNFCSTNVLTNTGGFIKYGWQSIVDRCNQLTTSGSVIVENRYYFSKDQLGSVVGITDNSGNTVTTYDYDSYGNFTLSGSDIGNDRLYTGREYDKEINLYYLRARYYSSELGRFISRDPIDIADNINLYSYVGDNPVNAIDLNGLSSKAIIGIIRKSGEEMFKFRENSEWSWWNNDFDPDLNLFYYQAEFSGLGGKGKYDLVYFGDGIRNQGKEVQFSTSIKGVYDCGLDPSECDGNVNFAGDELNLGEISNVIAGLNSYRMGFSLNHLENAAMTTVYLTGGNGVEGEMADRKLYEYGYELGELEKKNGKLTDDEIIKYIKDATVARKQYLNNK